ncbi:Albonoursin synthase [Frankliniella fusca]|uniref:Albonoursin synthase n=1 Tax=Frankliniella fusca TaxID=407009 RepID=A0AAE1HR27_9NEOP|nr:Albonoursin synthase [Frankliniella fusca]
MNVKEDEKYPYYAQIAQLRERAATKMNIRNLVDCYVDRSVEVTAASQNLGPTRAWTIAKLRRRAFAIRMIVSFTLKGIATPAGRTLTKQLHQKIIEKIEEAKPLCLK